MTTAPRKRTPTGEDGAVFDRELGDLPQELRWREWMGRIEAVLFASTSPVARDDLVRVVGQEASVEMLIEDIQTELTGRPYELVQVAAFGLREPPGLDDHGVGADARQVGGIGRGRTFVGSGLGCRVRGATGQCGDRADRDKHRCGAGNLVYMHARNVVGTLFPGCDMVVKIGRRLTAPWRSRASATAAASVVVWCAVARIDVQLLSNWLRPRLPTKRGPAVSSSRR